MRVIIGRYPRDDSDSQRGLATAAAGRCSPVSLSTCSTRGLDVVSRDIVLGGRIDAVGRIGIVDVILRR